MTLLDILSLVKGVTFATIETETEVKLTGGKKNQFQGRVTKKAISNVMLFSNSSTNSYENMVRKNLNSIGLDGSSFELKERKWGQRLPNIPVVEHNEQLYLECIFIKNLESKVFVDNVETDKNSIEGYPLVNPSISNGFVIIRDYKFSSIKKIRIFNEEYSF